MREEEVDPKYDPEVSKPNQRLDRLKETNNL